MLSLMLASSCSNKTYRSAFHSTILPPRRHDSAAEAIADHVGMPNEIVRGHCADKPLDWRPVALGLGDCNQAAGICTNGDVCKHIAKALIPCCCYAAGTSAVLFSVSAKTAPIW
jgi:hypothetical protein